MTPKRLERAACNPTPLNPTGFNHQVSLPHGLLADHVRSAMQGFLDFLGFINQQLHRKQLPRLEAFLMPANFSSMVGEFMTIAIPKFCPTIVKNCYHNGHPDLLPLGMYPGDSVLHAGEGIEVKASRHVSGWQGHNPEDVWLMVFVFDANSSRDVALGIAPKPFSFLKVLGARLT